MRSKQLPVGTARSRCRSLTRPRTRVPRPGGRNGLSAGRPGGRRAGGRGLGGSALGALRPGWAALATAPAPQPPEPAPCAGPRSQQHLLGSAGDAAGAQAGAGWVQSWRRAVRRQQLTRGRDPLLFGPTLWAGGEGVGAPSFPGGFVDALRLCLLLPPERAAGSLFVLPPPDSDISV